MAEFSYQKAVFYKEWLHKRWAALFVFLLIAPSVYLQTLMPLNGRRIIQIGSPGHWQAVDVVALNFADTVNQIDNRYTTGIWACLVVVVFALYSIWIERYHDTFWFTLGGPTSKSTILRTKFLVDAAIIVGVFTVLGASLCIIDGAVHAHYPIAGIARWWLAEVGILMGMYGLTVLISTVLGNPFAAGIIIFGVAVAPMYLGALLVNWLGENLIYFVDGHTTAHIPTSWKLMWIISHLSPLNWYNMTFTKTWGHPALFFVWFLLASLICCWLAVRLFERADNERLSNLFVFRQTQHGVALILSAVVAFIVVDTALHQASTTHAAYLMWFCVVTAIIWLLFTFVRLRWLKVR